MSNSSCDTAETLFEDAELMVSARFPQAAPSEAVALVQIGDRLHAAVRTHVDQLDVINAIVSIVAEYATPHAVLYLMRDAADGSLLPGTCIHGSLESIDTSHDELTAAGKSACACGHPVIAPLGQLGDCSAIALPVPVPHGAAEVLMAIVSTPIAADANVTRLLELAAVHIAWWQSQHEMQVAEYELASTAALQEILEQMETGGTVEHACQLLASQLQSYFGCQQVAVALRRRGGGGNRLQAIAGIESFDRHTPLASAVESALDEAVIRDTLTIWPPASPEDRHATLAHQKLVEVSGAPCAVSLPLRNRHGEGVGAWVFLGTEQCLGAVRTQNFLLAAETRVATCLSLLQRVRRGPIRSWCLALLKRRRTVKGAVAAFLLAGLVGLFAIPVDYRINCDCRLEPVTRRFVAAPYDGILKESLVEPGAAVSCGDALVRMDGREIRWELATVTAERDRAEKKRDAAFANHKFAAAEIARLEIEGYESKIELLGQRQENLLVKSPIDGIVTSGDLDQAQGAPVTRGQTLFEIAPLDHMVVEIAVPEREVPYVKAGQHVLVRLESRPRARYMGVVENVHPRSEIRDRENVFIAQVMLANPNGELRPGMHGTSKIRGPQRTMAWSLFHKPWESFCMMCGW